MLPLSTLYPLIFAAIAFGFCLLFWITSGREPKGSKVIVPFYKPPKGISVLEAGVLLDDIVNIHDIGYEIYNLLLKNIVTFDGLYLHLDNYDKIYDLNLTPGQIILLKGLFEDGKRSNILLKDSSKESLNKLWEIKKQIYESLTAAKYYQESPVTRKTRYLFVSNLLIIFAGFSILMYLISTVPLYLIMSISTPYILISQLPLELFSSTSTLFAGIIVGLFGRTVPRKSKEGVKIKEDILGFKMFMKTAEHDRIEYFFKEKPAYYNNILPFANLFGVLDKWEKPLHDINSALIPKEQKELFKKVIPENFYSVFDEKNAWFHYLFNFIFTEILKLGKGN